MEEIKNAQSSDAATADLAKKLSEGKPMQAGKFSGATTAAMSALVTGTTEKAPSGLTFDEVLIAIKAGKSAYRKIWTNKDGSIMLKLVPATTEAGVTGMSFDRGGIISRAGMHNDDILSNDWIIL